MPRKELSIPRRAIVASARNYTAGRSQEKKDKQRNRTAKEWMYAGWDFYDMISEYHQGCVAIGSLLSRAKLFVEEQDAFGAWAPTENPAVLAVHDQLYGGEEGQSEMLRQLGLHLAVTGEGWIVAETTAATTPEEWMVASPTVIRKSAGNGWRVNDEEFPDAYVIRVWRPHALDRNISDCPTRALLPRLSEYLQLMKRIAAQVDSRLLGGGILFVPSETSVAAGPTKQLNQGENPVATTDGVSAGDAQGLADLIVEQARNAIANPEDPSATMPLIAETPGEYIKEIKLQTFWSELDKAAPGLRKELREAIATGMDIPPEVLLGGQGTNHWNAWLSDENSVKIHAEPTLKLVVSSLRTGYLLPALKGIVPDPRKFRYAADTSQMRLRPNRSKEAMELNDRFILSDEATARENGFIEADLMTEEQRAQKLALKAASGSTTPEIVAAALKMLGVDLNIPITDLRAPAEARPTPTLQDHPTRDIPQEQQAIAASAAATFGLLYAAEQMVDRALQRAGNRLKTTQGLRSTGLSANRIYQVASIDQRNVADLLEDAWTPCEEFDYGVDGERLARALDIYTRGVLISGREPSRHSLATALKVLLDA